MFTLLLILPFFVGGLAYLTRADLVRRELLLTVALLHAAITADAWIHPPEAVPGSWLALDLTGLYVLSLVSGLFLMASCYAVAHLARTEADRRLDRVEGPANSPEATFTACLLCFLGTLTLVTLSPHLGRLRLPIEATALAGVPLMYRHRHLGSLEATWKYLLIGSVGIALALLGNFCLAIGAEGVLPGDRHSLAHPPSQTGHLSLWGALDVQRVA